MKKTTRRIVFSSSWSRVRQAKELDEWQQKAHKLRPVSTRHRSDLEKVALKFF